jgi:hypothetical protein
MIPKRAAVTRPTVNEKVGLPMNSSILVVGNMDISA